MIFRRRHRQPSSEDSPPRKGYGVALGNAMAEFEVMLNPAAEHRIVEMRHLDEIAEIDWSGELDDDGDLEGVTPSS
jgi:hypothetical protein